jgi:hypothetical protein
MADDPEEMITDPDVNRKIKADPKGAAKAAGTPVAVYTPPTGSHPKVARKSASDRLTLSEARYQTATLELSEARKSLYSCEMAEAETHQELIKLMKPPDADQNIRDHLARGQAERADRVAQGLSPDPVQTTITARSPIDVAAARRQKVSPGVAGYALRSPVSRR